MIRSQEKYQNIDPYFVNFHQQLLSSDTPTLPSLFHSAHTLTPPLPAPAFPPPHSGVEGAGRLAAGHPGLADGAVCSDPGLVPEELRLSELCRPADPARVYEAAAPLRQLHPQE